MTGERVTRRLAAILAADVVGYSRLMGRDEAGTLAAVKADRRDLIDPLLKRHGGRTVKSTGDGLLLEFSSSVEAVKCAVAIQGAVAARNAARAEDERMAYRIGINVGDIIVDGDDIFGDGVNVAARLEQLAAPGGICLSDRTLHDVRGRLEATFHDGGARELKNIAEPVRVWHWSVDGAQGEARAAPASDSPSIAVVPFAILSDDRALGFVADALVEDVIALLARMPGFFVISRASSFAFRERAGDTARIARELGVRYIVDGSLRSTADGVRVAAQLNDAASGRVLWSGRFDSTVRDASELQDEITRAVVGHLVPELTRAEIAVIRRRRADNVDAWGHFFQAQGEITLGGWSEATVASACAHLDRAIAADPTFALAYGQSALLKALAGKIGVMNLPQIKDESARAAEKAIELDSNSSEVLGLAGCALADIGQRERGIEVLERALDIDPSNAQAHVALGATRCQAAETREQGIAGMRHGMRLSPRDKRLGFWGWALSNTLVQSGRHGEAIEEARLAARRDPKLHLARIAEALGLANLERVDEARAALATARKLRPELTLEEVRRSHGRRALALLTSLWA